MSDVTTTDLVIVGAGMVGLTLAALLKESDIQIEILEHRKLDPSSALEWEKAERESGYDPRVSALTVASQQVLTVAGAWPLISSMRLTPYRHMDVWDGEGTGHIHFDCAELQEPCLGHIVENRVTQAALCEVVAAQQNVRFRSDTSIKELSEPGADGRRTLLLNSGEQLKTRLVVAADGALSHSRKLAGISMWEWDYGHHAIVTTVKTEQANQQTCWQRFTGDGPLALLPLADPNLSSIVWSTSPDHARELMALDNKAFCAELGRAIEHRLGDVVETDQRYIFPLRQRHAKQYVKEGFAAIGDAAHTIHPLAGQGVNLGLMDAAALAEEIISGIEQGVNWSSEYQLRRFQRNRQRENLQMAATMEGFKRLFNSRNPLALLMRNSGMNLMDSMSPVKNHIVQQAMGLSGNLPTLAQRPVRD